MSRRERERQLRELWTSRHGQHQVLRLFWNIRRQDAPPRAGESVIDAILDHEFGESGAE